MWPITLEFGVKAAIPPVPRKNFKSLYKIRFAQRERVNTGVWVRECLTLSQKATRNDDSNTQLPAGEHFADLTEEPLHFHSTLTESTQSSSEAPWVDDKTSQRKTLITGKILEVRITQKMSGVSFIHRWVLLFLFRNIFWRIKQIRWAS